MSSLSSQAVLSEGVTGSLHAINHPPMSWVVHTALKNGPVIFCYDKFIPGYLYC